MYLIKTPRFVKEFFPQLVWEINAEAKELYLTFDDGPHPEITPLVVEKLNRYEAKATFFCVGENITKYPETFRFLEESGQSVGSHTYNHLNGWATENDEYFNNVKKAATLVKSPLFRPPYGRIKPSQAKFLSRHYKIVMWDILSGDFDKNLSGETCCKNVISHDRPGSIVVFHDSEKARERMLYALPQVLEHFSKEGYVFRSLGDSFAHQTKQALRLERQSGN